MLELTFALESKGLLLLDSATSEKVSRLASLLYALSAREPGVCEVDSTSPPLP